MSARAKVVLPAPRSPESETKSPGCSELAISRARRRVACSSGSTTEKLDVSAVVSTIARPVQRPLPPRYARSPSPASRGRTIAFLARASNTISSFPASAKREAGEGDHPSERSERVGVEGACHSRKRAEHNDCSRGGLLG